jgi:hypothetical protein
MFSEQRHCQCRSNFARSALPGSMQARSRLVRIAKGAVVTGQEARRRPTAIVGITGIRRQLQRVQGIWENDSRLAEKGRCHVSR